MESENKLIYGEGPRRAASLILAFCAVVLLLTWHGYEGHPMWIWDERVFVRHLNDLDFLLKIAGAGLLAAALLSWPRPRA